MNPPRLLVSDTNGAIIEVPQLAATAMIGNTFVVPKKNEFVPLPQSSTFFTLPGRIAIGYEELAGQFVPVPQIDGVKVFPVAAFLPPGHIQTLHCAYLEVECAPRLPLFCYTAISMVSGRFYAAAARVDHQMRHEIIDVTPRAIEKKASAILKQYPRNRLIKHLVTRCVRIYKCPNACNLVLGRAECPIPVSSTCNAACLGCISQQPKGSCIKPPQHRIPFVPTVKEIVEYVVPHLTSASNPIASFGQGCEGEPLLQTSIIEQSIKEIRTQTKRGVINCNTNASLPDRVEQLCKAGLNSMRVSMNSAQSDYYRAYYKPRNYTFNDVIESIRIARKYNVWVSINYLTFPGFTDLKTEYAALKKFIKATDISMVQLRNLNIDPLWFARELGLDKNKKKSMGMLHWLHTIKKDLPDLTIGCFNPTLGTMRRKINTP